MNNKSLINPLYRSLLKLGKKFDKYPLAKALVWRKLEDNENLGSVAFKYYSEVLGRLFYDRDLLFGHGSEISFVKFVRDEFKRQSTESQAIGISTRIEAGFGAIRKFSSVWSMFDSKVKLDIATRDIESQLSAKDLKINVNVLSFSYAPAIEPGMILVANPIAAHPFKRAIILVLHSTSKSVYGLIINKPKNHTVGTGFRGFPVEAEEAFKNSPVYFGGMRVRTQFIHTMDNIGGTPIPGCTNQILYSGGDLIKAAQLVTDDPSLLDHIRFYAGCCTWKLSVIHNEIHAGKFLLSSSCPDALFSLQNEPTRRLLENDDVDEADIDGDDFGVADLNANYSATGNDPMWPAVMKSLGDPYGNYIDLPIWLDQSYVDSVDW